MGQINLNRVTNANVYINGNSMLGKAEEIDMPRLVARMVEHKALGMQGLVELPAGFDKMEARIKWNAFYADTMTLMADPYEVVNLQCRASVENYNSTGRSTQTPLVIFMRGQFKNVPTGNFKQHDNVEFESNLAVTYVKVEHNGVALLEFDALANIFKVNGVDKLAQYRANIGA